MNKRNSNLHKRPTNLVLLHKIGSGPNRVDRKARRFLERQAKSKQNVVQRIVKKALYRFAPHIAKDVIHGFYRSDGSDEAAERNFLNTDQPYHDVSRDYHYRRALRVVEKLFRPSRILKPISFPDLRYYPWTLPTSAEAPYTFKKKWVDYIRKKQKRGEISDGNVSFHNLYNEIFHINRKHIHFIKRRMRPFWKDGVPAPYYWSTLHTRAHLRKNDQEPKNRAVFGVTKLLLMVENMFIWNLQKEYLNGNVRSPMLWGYETIRGGWYKLVRDLSVRGQPNTFISADWSEFDVRALHEVIDDVHDMWRNWFSFEDGYEETNIYPDTKCDPFQIQSLWDWMCHAVKHTPIAGQSGQLYQWRHNGIASGFQQTQLLDSFVNAIMLLTCYSSLGINIESDSFYLKVQGDDSLSAFNELVLQLDRSFLTRLEAEALTRFNAKLSADKTSAGEHLNQIEVLSYKNRSGIAYRDEKELLAHLLYPERHRDLGATAASALGIAIASMGCSEAVYDVCYDVHRFITQDLKVDPAIRGVLWLTRLGLDLDIDFGRFPSFKEIYAQNFDLRERSEGEKNRLWPTTPVGITEITPKGFYFLNK
nr:MAG: RNA-dependent RNA polymerase [brine shrimp partitivirus 1]